MPACTDRRAGRPLERRYLPLPARDLLRAAGGWSHTTPLFCLRRSHETRTRPSETAGHWQWLSLNITTTRLPAGTAPGGWGVQGRHNPSLPCRSWCPRALPLPPPPPSQATTWQWSEPHSVFLAPQDSEHLFGSGAAVPIPSVATRERAADALADAEHGVYSVEWSPCFDSKAPSTA